MSNLKCTSDQKLLKQLQEELQYAQKLDLQKLADIIVVPDTFKLLALESVENKFNTLVLKIEYKDKLHRVWCTQPLQRFVTSPLVQKLIQDDDFTFIPITVKDDNNKFVYSIE